MKLQALLIGLLVLAVAATTLIRMIGLEQVEDAGRVAGTSVQQLQPSEKIEVSRPPRTLDDSRPNEFAHSAIVIDVASNYPLYANNADHAVPIASTTKIMTAIIVAEEYDLGDTVTVSQNAAQTIGSDIGLVWGEEISVDALLKGLLIQSGNDAAIALAEHIGYDVFIDRMNKKAAELGLTQTEFKDPAGLDDGGHSTARDLGVLGAYAIRNEIIRGIAQITEAVIQSSDLKFSHRLETSNRLLKSDHPLFLASATGLKTGYTPEAGHCLVASAEQDGHQLVTVVLRTHEDTAEASAKESNKLINWAFTTHEWNE